MRLLTLGILSLGLFVGCGSAEEPVERPAPEPTALQLQLETTRHFEIAPFDEGQSIVRLAAEGDWVPDQQVIDLKILDGSVAVRADEDGEMRLLELEMSFDDIVIAKEAHPPNGLHLTDLSVRLAEEVVCESRWRSDEASGEATMNLELDWSTVQSTGPKPLATQHLEDLPFIVEVVPHDDGSLTLEMSVHRQGNVWDFGTLVNVSDLRIELSELQQRN
jgi:hypothetical protein